MRLLLVPHVAGRFGPRGCQAPYVLFSAGVAGACVETGILSSTTRIFGAPADFHEARNKSKKSARQEGPSLAAPSPLK